MANIPLGEPHRIVAAIPCFNTEATIADVVIKAKKHVDRVLVIDDGSTDDTAAIAKKAGAMVVSHDVNRGYGGAIRSCFKVALEGGASVLVTLDGDGQHNPADIECVIAPILNGDADVVIGSRFIEEKGNMPRYRRFGIKLITALFNLGASTKIGDAQSGFRAYSGRVLEALFLKEEGMGVSMEILFKARAAGFRFAEAPVSCLYHEGGSTMNPLIHGISVALSVVRIRLAVMMERC